MPPSPYISLWAFVICGRCFQLHRLEPNHPSNVPRSCCCRLVVQAAIMPFRAWYGIIHLFSFSKNNSVLLTATSLRPVYFFFHSFTDNSLCSVRHLLHLWERSISQPSPFSKRFFQLFRIVHNLFIHVETDEKSSPFNEFDRLHAPFGYLIGEHGTTPSAICGVPQPWWDVCNVGSHRSGHRFVSPTLYVKDLAWFRTQAILHFDGHANQITRLDFVWLEIHTWNIPQITQFVKRNLLQK